MPSLPCAWPTPAARSAPLRPSGRGCWLGARSQAAVSGDRGDAVDGTRKRSADSAPSLALRLLGSRRKHGSYNFICQSKLSNSPPPKRFPAILLNAALRTAFPLRLRRRKRDGKENMVATAVMEQAQQISSEDMERIFREHHGLVYRAAYRVT